MLDQNRKSLLYKRYYWADNSDCNQLEHTIRLIECFLLKYIYCNNINII
jgi:hypothetical protein